MPMVVASGLTWTVMYSRIKDQQHWLSDTLTGALIGSAFATLFYTLHFDELGQPRTQTPPTPGIQPVPSTMGLRSSPFLIQTGMSW